MHLRNAPHKNCMSKNGQLSADHFIWSKHILRRFLWPDFRGVTAGLLSSIFAMTTSYSLFFLLNDSCRMADVRQSRQRLVPFGPRDTSQAPCIFSRSCLFTKKVASSMVSSNIVWCFVRPSMSASSTSLRFVSEMFLRFSMINSSMSLSVTLN